MQLKPGNFCPLMQKECIQLQCNWFIQVRGKNMNTGLDVDEWGCSVAWLPHLLIENANQTREAGAAIESFRNETVRANQNTLQTMLAVASNQSETPMRLVHVADNN